MSDAMIPLLIVSHCGLLILNVFMWLQLKRFLARTPEIRCDSDLQRFRDVVAVQMRFSLIALALIVIPLIVGVVGLATGSLTFAGFGLLAILPLLANTALIGVLSGPASEAKTLPADDRWQSDLDATVNTWRNRLYPDW